MKQFITLLILTGVHFACTAQDDTVRTSIPQTIPVIIKGDSAIVGASMQYAGAGSIKRKLLGDNYRAEWSAPVTLKIFDINKVKGGLRITELGGGKQTVSATLVEKNGKEWKLRTVDKDPAKAIPENFRSSIAADIVQDMISASHPYAPAGISRISTAAGVPHSYPEFYFVPDDKTFGEYSHLFANKVCILEEKDASTDSSDTKTTEKVIEKIQEENDHAIDQREVLKARILDILIGDWDRHFDQWRWGIVDTGKGKTYYPIPRDRDQAFFYTDGLVPRYISARRMPFIKGLRYDIPKINWAGYSARDFDRLFLNSLDKNDWEDVIGKFQNDVTDDVIDASVRDMPPEIYNLSGREIADKLKSRRKLLMTEGMKYYHFISKNVNIAGSIQPEQFTVSATNAGVLVQVNAIEEDKPLRLMYSRLFDPAVTKEIRLYGLDGDDRFTVEGDAGAKIRIRVIGGEGIDTFDMNGNLRKHIYDREDENNYILAQDKTSNHYANDTSVNSYNYNEYRYVQKHKFPYITAGFNPDDGVLLGIGFQLETYGFRKEPFATSNTLSTLYSITGKAYQAKYAGIFTDLLGKVDMYVNAEFQNPALTNFFGLGNETKKTREMFFYRTRYKFTSADVQGSIKLSERTRLSLGPSFFHYWNSPEDNAGKILQVPEAVGLAYDDVYDKKTYLGGKTALYFDNLNSTIFPTKGVNLLAEYQYLNGVQSSSSLSKFTADAAYYKGWLKNKQLVSLIRLGGGHIFNNDYEYFQALSLGANNYLRGYRKNRFSGQSLLYNSVELRYKLVDIKSYVIPGTLGLIGFNDVGRVWVQNEKSKTLHHAYGGGIFFLPYNLLIVGATVGTSQEELLVNISLGTKLNLIF